MKILNLHGFMGDADNKNYKALCILFPTEDIVSPKLNYIDTAPDKILDQLSDMVDSDDFIFVGQSLGGWYADKLSRKFNFPCILTNPCYYPHELKLITESDMPDEFVVQYYEMSVNDKNELAYSFCSDGDTLIPNNFDNCKKLSYEAIMVHGSHSTIENIVDHFSKLLAFNYTANEVAELKEKRKAAFLQEKPEWSDNRFLDIIFNQAIIEAMKAIFDKEMEQTERSLEKAFFPGVTDSNKDSTYDNEKGKIKRTLKKIEQYRYSEGDKIEKLSGEFPQKFISLKKEVDKTKSNFESNHYNISRQNVLEIRTLAKLEICEKILKKQISSVKKVSNTKFEDLYMEYDKHYSELIDNVNKIDVSANNYLSAFFDLFNFEDKFSLEWIYSFADYAVEHKIDEETFDRGKYLYASPIETPNGLYCMNRSFFLRDEFIPLLLECEYDVSGFWKALYEYNLYVELVYGLKNAYISSEALERISRSKWVAFIKSNYNLLGTFNQNKEWTPKKIKEARKVFDKWGINQQT